MQWFELTGWQIGKLFLLHLLFVCCGSSTVPDSSRLFGDSEQPIEIFSFQCFSGDAASCTTGLCSAEQLIGVKVRFGLEVTAVIVFSWSCDSPLSAVHQDVTLFLISLKSSVRPSPFLYNDNSSLKFNRFFFSILGSRVSKRPPENWRFSPLFTASPQKNKHLFSASHQNGFVTLSKN